MKNKTNRINNYYTIIIQENQVELRTFKYRIYPNLEQQSKLAQFFGAKRWIFNHYLHENKHRFMNKQQHLNNYDCNLDITLLKKQPETEWLKTIDDWCLKNAAEDLHVAFTNFFNSIKGKRKGPKLDAPRFKSRSNQQTYRTRGFKVDLENGKIKLPKIKQEIQMIVDRPFEGKMKYATVIKTPSGKYFVSILVEQEEQLLDSTGKEVGIDLGLKDLMILSNGIKFQHPEAQLAKAKLALKQQQRILSRKTKGSKNREAQRIKVARCFEKITNIKNWYYHNISRYLVDSFDAIYMENLNVNGMLKNRKLSRKIHETGWATLVTMIDYKSEWAGRTFHQIGRFIPSSKTCSSCGHKLDKLDLGTRTWDCPNCGTSHDRDLNAAVNIKNFGQLDCYDQTIPSVETIEVGSSIPMSLQKFTTKIERSDFVKSVGDGSRKIKLSVDVY
jgi:putative transposase